MTRSNPHGSMTRLNPELDRSEKRYDVRDPRLVEIIDSVMQELPPYAHRDLLREVVVTVVKLAEQNAQRGDLKILRSAVKELRYAYKIFDQYHIYRRSRCSARLEAYPNLPPTRPPSSSHDTSPSWAIW